MSAIQHVTVGKLLLYEHVYAGLITHTSRDKCIKCFLMLLGVCIGAALVVVFVWLLVWLSGAYNKEPLIKRLSFTPKFLTYIIVRWHQFVGETFRDLHNAHT